MKVDRTAALQYAILGPFEARMAGRTVPVGGPRQRSLLVLLLLNAGRTVPVDRIVDEVWDGAPPHAAERSVQVYVSRLRKALTAAADDGAAAPPLMTRAGGYLLDAEPDQVDAERFERMAGEGRRARDGGEHERAGHLLREALDLWRGPALVDFPQRWARTHATRLEEQRLAVVEARVEADLALGRHAELASELTVAVAEHPLRERLHAQRMLALYRCGRQAEALAAYREAYQALAGERGIDPGGELRALEAAVLRQDPGLDWSPPVRAVSAAPGTPRPMPAQLPAGIADFTGRTAELSELAAVAGPSPTPVMAITLVTGAAGVGKTALAVHWAHRIAPDFPDGQLYVDLRGHDAERCTRPLDALAQALRALGVEAEQIPTTQDEAAGTYRSLLAGRRVLVVLDNAASAEQVRPLLPGSPGCMVLVTSRDRLTGLVARDSARRLTLDTLPPDDATALLERILGTGRVRAEPAAAADLAAACGYLPLALRIAAANLLNHRHRGIAQHVAELRAGDRLAGLRVDGDEQSAVRVAFEQSYAALPAPARRVFRLLSLVPGADFTAGAVAALADVAAEEAGGTLDRLAQTHLIDQPAADRYTFHDLLRAFARERTRADDTPAEREAALVRLHDWYLRNVDSAAALLYPQMLRLSGPDGADPASFPDHAAALAWLDAERPNLVAAVHHLARGELWPAGCRLADALRGYFWIRRHTVDWLAVATAGRAAARAGQDTRAEAAAELSLAMANRCAVGYLESVEHYERAMTLSRSAGWTAGEAAAVNNVSCVYVRLGRLGEAEACVRRALDLDRRRGGGFSLGPANVGNLGYVYLRLGRLREARKCFAEALALRRRIGDRYGQADALQGLAECDHALGRPDVAGAQITEALSIFQDIGSLDGESLVRCVLAAIDSDAGRHREALEHARIALALVARTTDRYSEALARNRLGAVALRLDSTAESLHQHTRALDLAVQTHGPYPEAEAGIGLADALRCLGRHDEACERAGRAVAITRRVGLGLLEGEALTALANAHLAAGRTDSAAAHAQQAVAVRRRTGHRPPLPVDQGLLPVV